MPSLSLPDFAFRGRGAQNKTSLLFLRRAFCDRAQRTRTGGVLYEEEFAITGSAEGEEPVETTAMEDEDGDDKTNDDERPGAAAKSILNRAISKALKDFDYPVFLAEAEHLVPLQSCIDG